MKKVNAMNADIRGIGNAPKKTNYVAPHLFLKSVAVEDGFGASKFYGITTEQMDVVSWD